MVGASSAQVAHLREQHAAVHVGLSEPGLQLDRAVVVAQRALEVLRSLHANAEGEVVVSLGERLVELKSLLEQPLRIGEATFEQCRQRPARSQPA